MRRPPSYTRPDSLFPSTTLFRAPAGCAGRGSCVQPEALNHVRRHVAETAGHHVVEVDAEHPPGVGVPVGPGEPARHRQLGEGHDVGVAEARHLDARSEEQTSELQSLMRTSYAVLCLKKKTE